MKKFFICILILALFSGSIFWTGWTQRKIKPEETGILISKTSGINETPIMPGTFCWNWEFLLPTNAELRKFSLKPVNLKKTVTGQLPSADIFSDKGFDYSFTFTIGLSCTPQALPYLMKDKIISDNQDLQDYLSSAADALAQMTADYYLNKRKSNPDYVLEYARREDILRAIKFNQEYPDLQLTVFALTDYRLPDFELYQALKYQVLSNKDLLMNNINTEIIEEEENE